MLARLYITFFLFLGVIQAESVKSITGNIIFDTDNDGTLEAHLSTDGLSIGSNSAASQKLSVTGNVEISGNILSKNGIALSELSSAPTTVTGNGILYVDSTGDLIFKNDSGTTLNISDISPASASAWSPLDIDLWAWYDASDSTTITHSANAVSDWTDKSLNGRDLSQATAGNKPTTNSRTLNSLNVIDFDGNDYMNNLQFQFSNGSICVFMVAVIDAVDNNDDCMFSFDTGGTAVLRFRAGAQPEFEGDIVSSSGTDPTQTGADFKGPSIYMVNIDDSRDAIYGFIDGTRYTDSEETSSSLIANPVDFNLFANQNATDIPDGACAEIIVVISPTSVIRHKIEGYLAHKWGLEANLPSAHPYKSAAP